MPWPMVHLAISNILYAGNPTPSLLLGSIAPDAIHVRGQISRDEKGKTHLVQNGKLPTKELIIEMFNKYFHNETDPKWKDFIVGYFTHIYTDMRWTDTIYEDFEQAYEGNNIRSTYNREVSQIEFELQRLIDNNKELIKLLIRAEGHTIHPFVTQTEVNEYRDLKVQWINDLSNEPKIKPIYFDSYKVNYFIEITSKEIKDLFNDYGIKYFEEDRNIS